MVFERETVALSIECDSVRVVATQGRRVTKWGMRPLPDGAIREGLIVKPLEVGDAIDRLLAEMKLSRRRVVVAISGLRAISRILLLPRMRADLLASTIVHEARREIPVPLDEVYLSWQILGDRGVQQAVFLLGVPKEMMDASVHALRLAEIRPLSVDLSPLALARAVNQSTAIVANFEPDCVQATILVNDAPVVMRSVSLAGEIQDSAGHVNRMVEELISTVRFYNGGHKEEALPAAAPLYLTGSAADSPDLRDTVHGGLDYPITPLDPPFRFAAGFPVATYMANLGLALKRL